MTPGLGQGLRSSRLRASPGPSLTPLSRSMSRKWVALSSRGSRICGSGVLVSLHPRSASSGSACTWLSVLRAETQQVKHGPETQLLSLQPVKPSG